MNPLHLHQALIIIPFAICSLIISSATAQQADPLPTLDELLGLEEPSTTTTDQIIIDANDTLLDQKLDAQQAGKAFTQAVGIMDQVSNRITNNNDFSLTTQRLQEDILTMLDQVIESASSNQSKGSSSSSSSSQSSSSQDQPNQSQQSKAEKQPGSDGESSTTSIPQGSSDAKPGDEVAPDGVRWGSLPERIRDALSQGISDQYSELYRSLTEQYYKALAEDED